MFQFDVGIEDSACAFRCFLAPTVGVFRSFGSAGFPLGSFDMGYLGYQSCLISLSPFAFL